MFLHSAVVSAGPLTVTASTSYVGPGWTNCYCVVSQSVGIEYVRPVRAPRRWRYAVVWTADSKEDHERQAGRPEGHGVEI